MHLSSYGSLASGPQNAHPTPSIGSVSASPPGVVLSLPRTFKIDAHSLTGPSDRCPLLPQINAMTSCFLGWASAMLDRRHTFLGTMRPPHSVFPRLSLITYPPCSCWVPKAGGQWKGLCSRNAPCPHALRSSGEGTIITHVIMLMLQKKKSKQ